MALRRTAVDKFEAGGIRISKAVSIAALSQNRNEGQYSGSINNNPTQLCMGTSDGLIIPVDCRFKYGMRHCMILLILTVKSYITHHYQISNNTPYHR